MFDNPRSTGGDGVGSGDSGTLGTANRNDGGTLGSGGLRSYDNWGGMGHRCQPASTEFAYLSLQLTGQCLFTTGYWDNNNYWFRGGFWTGVLVMAYAICLCTDKLPDCCWMT